MRRLRNSRRSPCGCHNVTTSLQFWRLQFFASGTRAHSRIEKPACKGSNAHRPPLLLGSFVQWALVHCLHKPGTLLESCPSIQGIALPNDVLNLTNKRKFFVRTNPKIRIQPFRARATLPPNNQSHHQGNYGKTREALRTSPQNSRSCSTERHNPPPCLRTLRSSRPRARPRPRRLVTG